jgi:hypothetical protein
MERFMQPSASRGESVSVRLALRMPLTNAYEECP